MLLFQFLVRLKALGSLSIPSLKCLMIPLDTPVDWLIKYEKISLPLLTVSLIMLSKLNVFVKGMELKSSNIEVNSFCQKRENDIWIDLANNENDDSKIENAILNQAKKN